MINIEPETETMVMLDTTTSMNYLSAPGGPLRKDLLHEAFSIIVDRLAAADSQAKNEGDGGGLRCITFADDKAHDIGDLNPQNLRTKWAGIRWSGGTYIMPGLREVMKTYNKEFGQRQKDDRPTLALLVITDGEAEDTDEFARALEGAKDQLHITLAIVGYGSEHDKALEAYERVAQSNSHVKVVSFNNETDPESIASGLLRMIA